MSSVRSLTRSLLLFVHALFFLTLYFGGNAGVQGENIVFFHPTGSYSHRTSLWPLVEKLVEKGHQITFISSHLPKDPLPNVTELVPTQMAKYIHDYHDGGDLDVMKRLDGTLEACYDHGPRMGMFSCEKFLDDPVTQDWLKTNPKIDLIILDWFISECILGLAYKVNAPFIFYAPTVMVGTFYETFGVLPDAAGVPDFESHFTPPMNFWQRAHNAIQPIIWEYKMTGFYKNLENLLRDKLNIPDMPPMMDIVKNASLMMWSESIIEGYPQQLPPNWVNVGGMHCKDNTDPLPEDMEQIVQNGKDGFVYISFGSAVVPGNLPKTYQDAFLNAIRSFPNIQFLWKWSGPTPQELPSNLHIAKWFPQQDLLAHKKILAFVTQAGRPSTQEAIFHAVPVISIPVYEDQDFTAERVRDMGGGLVVEIATLKQEEFEDAIREITTNKKYKTRMQKLSQLFKDRPMKPADTALYWTEYVLRHKGDMTHLRSPSFNLTWYQRRQIDVWAFFLGVALVVLSASVFIIVMLLKFLCKLFVSGGKKHAADKTKRKQKKNE